MRTPLELIGARCLLLSAALSLLLPATLIALMTGPWSPWALERADALVRKGEPQLALSAYQGVARWSFSEADEADALYRGGLLAAAEAERPQVAVRMLRRLTTQHADHPHQVDALARMGRVLGDQLGDPLRAATLLREAAELQPEHPQAAARLLSASSYAESADATSLAWVVLEQVAREHPERAHAAWLAMARLRLSAGDAHGAEELYRRVLDADPTEAVAQLAQLGLSISLEDLGDAEGAAAVADLGDGSALELRRDRLRERNELRSR